MGKGMVVGNGGREWFGWLEVVGVVFDSES